MSTSFDSFLPYILPNAPGCTDVMAYQALRNTAIDFCRRTDIDQSIQAVSVAATTEDYTLIVPTDKSFSRLMFAGWQGIELLLAPPPDVRLDTALRGVTIGTAIPAAGSPKYAFNKTPTLATVSVYPIPDTSLASGFTFKASWFPALTALTLDDALYSDYAEVLAAGALARLVIMPSQLFTAPAAAAAFKDTYERGVQMAKRQAFRGRMASNQRVSPVAFAI